MDQHELFEKWQETIGIIAEIFNVPSALIMRIVNDELEVYVASKRDDNPYIMGNSDILKDSGLYCETVINSKKYLYVKDAEKDSKWKKRLPVNNNMLSYLGMPIILPSGKVYGTICVLDHKASNYSALYINLLRQFKYLIEAELYVAHEKDMLLEVNKKLRESFEEIELLREILPICSFCKSIRNDNGFWEKVDEYLKNHADIEFTHSVCPDCMKKYYPNIDIDEELKKSK